MLYTLKELQYIDIYTDINTLINKFYNEFSTYPVIEITTDLGLRVLYKNIERFDYEEDTHDKNLLCINFINNKQISSLFIKLNYKLIYNAEIIKYQKPKNGAPENYIKIVFKELDLRPYVFKEGW